MPFKSKAVVGLLLEFLSSATPNVFNLVIILFADKLI